MGDVFRGLQQHRALKAEARRWGDLGARFAKHLETSLGPAGMATLKSAEHNDVRALYVTATTLLLRAMSQCDGSVESIDKIGRASDEYLKAYLGVLKATRGSE